MASAAGHALPLALIGVCATPSRPRHKLPRAGRSRCLQEVCSTEQHTRRPTSSLPRRWDVAAHAHPGCRPPFPPLAAAKTNAAAWTPSGPLIRCAPQLAFVAFAGRPGAPRGQAEAAPESCAVALHARRPEPCVVSSFSLCRTRTPPEVTVRSAAPSRTLAARRLHFVTALLQESHAATCEDRASHHTFATKKTTVSTNTRPSLSFQPVSTSSYKL
jgi:hypothetical protein